jgi:uncharacterized protein with von Willebrand factor type A (vWA) domain
MLYSFVPYIEPHKTNFDKLFSVFRELILYTSGDVDEALEWLEELNNQYQIAEPEYSMDDFVEELKKRGFLREEIPTPGGLSKSVISEKTERLLRRHAMEKIFGKLKKSGRGNHRTSYSGAGGDEADGTRPYRFGDAPEQIDMQRSLHNAMVRGGVEQPGLLSQDLEVRDRYHQSSVATVLMIDISHSMILYGEDRITPAKQVALALSELITTRYPKDALDIIVFGNDAWPVALRELPYLQVGPYHTNTVAGLELAMNILSRKRNSNKQIMMITDGKPSCLKEADGTYYKNSVGLDEYIVSKCLHKAVECKKMGIPITTFMIAKDPYLMQFIDQFSKVNGGRALFTGLNGLGEILFHDYENNRKRKNS